MILVLNDVFIRLRISSLYEVVASVGGTEGRGLAGCGKGAASIHYSPR